LPPNIGRVQHIEAFGIGSHDPVLDAVMDHLDEVAGTVWPAVQIALLRSALRLVTPWRARDVAHAWCEPGKDRIEPLHHRFLTANHHAISALEAPHTATRSNVNVVYALGGELLGTTNVVAVVR